MQTSKSVQTCVMDSRYLVLQGTPQQDTFKLYNSRYTVGCKKNGNCQNKIDTFLQFFHSVKPSYER
jgi:hypothetical protein